MQYAITTRSPLAQRHFEQALQLFWANELSAAEAAFSVAESYDRRCAMCAWGIALVRGPALGVDGRAEMAGRVRDDSIATAAIERASRRQRFVSGRERALIEATGQWFRADLSFEAAQQQFSQALWHASAQFPDDDELRTLALLTELPPRSGSWTAVTFTPARTASAQFDSLFEHNALYVLQRTVAHPGACRLLMSHPSTRAKPRAAECAEHVVRDMPDARYLLHLSAVVFVLRGRYGDAVHAARSAIAADMRFEPDAPNTPRTKASAIDDVSRWHLLSFAALMQGREAMATGAAREAAARALALDAEPQHELMRETAVAAVTSTLVAFGRWRAVLAEPVPPRSLPYARGLTLWSRGVAHAAQSEWTKADSMLNDLRRLVTRQRNTRDKLSGNALRIAVMALSGEIKLQRGESAPAAVDFLRAAAIQDDLPYALPPFFPSSVRLSLGRALLSAGRASDAVQAYETDLLRYPENGWALAGLYNALAGTGRFREANLVLARFNAAFPN